METENFIALPASGDSVCKSEDDDQHNFLNGPVEIESQHAIYEDKEEELNIEEVGHKIDIKYEDGHLLPEAVLETELIDNDSDMEIEDLSGVPALTDSGCGLDMNGIPNFSGETKGADCQPSILAHNDIKITSKHLVPSKGDAQCEDSHCMPKLILDKDLIDNASLLQVSVKLTENVAVAEASNTRVSSESCCLAIQDENSIGIKKMDGNSILGVKRARMMFDEQEPQVCVKYTSLTRASKLKLEELLQQWSEWHAQHDSSSQDPIEALESGEETFFPALHVGLEKTSSVSFWMDKQLQKQPNKEFIELDCNSVPLYDRGYALGLTSDGGTNNIEGGLEIIDDAARCFNCGSYNHSLKECPKPRDRVAVNNARKQLKSKRNQNPGSRNPTRYYQNSPAGKYDGLRPGALEAETRLLLGLGELDPPPWLNRMREIGYPPGYLDPDDEDQPSGITIFADEEIKEEQEDGEIVETDNSREPKRKKTVDFPGINGPIPENADERRWNATPSSSDISRNRSHSHRRSHNVLEQLSRGHHREERRSREFRDDGPPGVDEGFSPATSTFIPRYGSSYESESNINNSHSPRLDAVGRFETDRGRRSRFLDEGFSNHGSFSSSSYLSRLSPKDYGSVRYENRADESRKDYDLDYSTHSRDRLDRHRHLGRR